MFDRLARALVYLSGRSDLIVAILMLVAIVMIIIPLPTWLVDGLIAINISVSMLVLLVVFYIARPVEFSSFPSVILIATLFGSRSPSPRRGSSCFQADAGDIVTAFGSFVIGGDIAVGLVVFLIITVAQFVVITKGASASPRSPPASLDAMPGKQMAIDSDLRAGDIDQAEANRLRRGLEREPFVRRHGRGDEVRQRRRHRQHHRHPRQSDRRILVGTMKHGMTVGTAAETYALLSVGDGLVAQIPSLFVSVAAGTLVTCACRRKVTWAPKWPGSCSRSRVR